MKITRAVIDLYRNLSVGKQRFIANLLYSCINMPLMGNVYHWLYSRRISREGSEIRICSNCRELVTSSFSWWR
jgi:lysine/ornithine N-monooxygenase